MSLRVRSVLELPEAMREQVETALKADVVQTARLEYTCSWCARRFMRFQSLVGTNTPCCSVACSAKLLAKPGELNPNWKGGPSKGRCQHCGVEFEKEHGKAGPYCSKSCFYAGSFRRGAPRWAGGRWGNQGCASGTRADLGIYVRSSWEANYARYLSLLKSMAAISEWKYEPETFDFPVKRGTRFYTPDFRVLFKDGSTEFHEVKGWMNVKSATALKRMAKYHPTVKVLVIGKKEYMSIKRKWRSAIPTWEAAMSKGNP